MNQDSIYVGIDISKVHLDVYIDRDNPHLQVGKGVQALTERLQALGPQLVVLEATGGLERTPGIELDGCRYPCSHGQSPTGENLRNDVRSSANRSVGRQTTRGVWAINPGKRRPRQPPESPYALKTTHRISHEGRRSERLLQTAMAQHADTSFENGLDSAEGGIANELLDCGGSQTQHCPCLPLSFQTSVHWVCCQLGYFRQAQSRHKHRNTQRGAQLAASPFEYMHFTKVSYPGMTSGTQCLHPQVTSLETPGSIG